MTGFLPTFVRFLVLALYVLLFGRVLISWVSPRYDSPIARFFYETTEPILAPIRRVLPATGMIDWSPFVAIIVLGIIASALRIA